MFYVYPNGSSGWSISVEPPVNQEYYEFETLPDGDGTIVYRDGELVRVPPVEPVPNEVEQNWVYDPNTNTFSEPVPTPDPRPTPSGDYNEFIAGLMEGYQNG